MLGFGAATAGSVVLRNKAGVAVLRRLPGAVLVQCLNTKPTQHWNESLFLVWHMQFESVQGWRFDVRPPEPRLGRGSTAARSGLRAVGAELRGSWVGMLLQWNSKQLGRWLASAPLVEAEAVGTWWGMQSSGSD